MYANSILPITYWHKHKTKCINYKLVKRNGISNNSNDFVYANCKMCTQQNSVTIHEIPFFDYSPKIIFNRVGFFYVIKKMNNPGYIESNKGPPDFI